MAPEHRTAPPGPPAPPDPAAGGRRTDLGQPRTAGYYGMLFVRYGVGSILVLAGLVMLVVSPGGFGVDGFGMSVGAGLSVLMLNWLYRLGVSGDDERRREEDARRYLAEHGHWPDERAPGPNPATTSDSEPAGGSTPKSKPKPAGAEHHGLPSRRSRAGTRRPPRRGPA